MLAGRACALQQHLLPAFPCTLPPFFQPGSRAPLTCAPPPPFHNPSPQLAATHAVEERIRDRLPLNGHLGFRKLMDDLTALGCSPQAVGLAVKVMLAKGELKKKNEGKLLQRVR